MAYFRYKKIKGKKYYYIVESYWTNGQCKQRVLVYIGNADTLLNRLKNKEVKKNVLQKRRSKII
jgi:hypothetical protein